MLKDRYISARRKRKETGSHQYEHRRDGGKPDPSKALLPGVGPVPGPVPCGSKSPRAPSECLLLVIVIRSGRGRFRATPRGSDHAAEIAPNGWRSGVRFCPVEGAERLSPGLFEFRCALLFPTPLRPRAVRRLLVHESRMSTIDGTPPSGAAVKLNDFGNRARRSVRSNGERAD